MSDWTTLRSKVLHSTARVNIRLRRGHEFGAGETKAARIIALSVAGP